ncbi:MAG: PepSY domain-containing protein [Alphaproteobacteria bacterium]|jgi:hypothetical protein
MIRPLVLALALMGLAAAGPAHARFAEGDGLWQMAQDAEFVPLEIIFGDLRALYSGHQLSASGPVPSGGGYVYRIKWLTDDGAVLYVIADAETGEILSVEGE